MKLTELNPRWVIAIPEMHRLDFEGPWANRHGMGIAFDCPKCKTHRLAVMFTNPIDKGLPAEGQNLWTITSGDGFANLSLAPSIDATRNAPPLAPNLGFRDCWHGFITNGEVT